MFNFKKVVPTVEAALAGFHKAIADLKAVKEHHDAAAAKHEEAIHTTAKKADEAIAKLKASAQNTITRVQELKDAAEKEAILAARAIAKVEAFVGL